VNKREAAKFASARAKRPAEFLNVDLVVFSERPLDLLAQAMEKCGAIVLDCGPFHRGGFWATFEANMDGIEANRTIKAIGRLVGRLPAPARRLFDRAKRREFSIGIQSAKEPHAFDVPVSAQSLAVVTALRGELSITVYSPITAKKLVAPSQAKTRKRKAR
jgi:hypothetical protein